MNPAFQVMSCEYSLRSGLTPSCKVKLSIAASFRGFLCSHGHRPISSRCTQNKELILKTTEQRQDHVEYVFESGVRMYIYDPTEEEPSQKGLLQTSSEDEPSGSDTDDSNTDDESNNLPSILEKSELQSLRVKQLKRLCKALNFKRYSSLRKKELLQLLDAHWHSDSSLCTETLDWQDLLRSDVGSPQPVHNRDIGSKAAQHSAPLETPSMDINWPDGSKCAYARLASDQDPETDSPAWNCLARGAFGVAEPTEVNRFTVPTIKDIYKSEGVPGSVTKLRKAELITVIFKHFQAEYSPAHFPTKDEELVIVRKRDKVVFFPKRM